MPGVRELIADPPIRNRLVWQGLLNPGARDFGDLAVTASAFGVVYSAAGAVGLLLAALDPFVDHMLMFAATSIVTGMLGLACLIGYRRLPAAFFAIAAAAAIGLVTVAAIASEKGAAAVFAPAYAVIVVLCLLFMPPRLGFAEGVLAVAAYGAVLIVGDTPYAGHLLVSSTVMLCLLGVLIWVMRTRTERIAGELSTDAYADSLTTIPNRRAFDARFELELLRAKRDDTPVSLVICDLDHFKRINDERGHKAGDAVLRRAATAIAEVTRAADLAARIGGEEFGLILPGAGENEAAIAAERVRRRVAAEFAEGDFEITISCGIACASGADAVAHSLFSAADGALYEAKRGGRNCTATAGADGATIVDGDLTGRPRQPR